MNKRSIWDIVLLPKRFYQNITDKRITLFFGILLVGTVDVLFPDIVKSFGAFFAGRTGGQLAVKTIMLLAAIIVMGIIDVLFFSIPLFDFCKFLTKGKDSVNNNSKLVKIMKVYITAHFFVIAFEILHYTVFRNVNFDTVSVMSQAFAYLSLLFMLWFYAIVCRGINVLFNFTSIFKSLVFISVVAWSTLLGIALDFIMQHWIKLLIF